MKFSVFVGVLTLIAIIGMWFSFTRKNTVLTIISLALAGLILMLVSLFKAVGKTEVTVSVGDMKDVNGRYFSWVGEYHDNLCFYALDDDDDRTVREIYTSSYDIRVSEAKAYTYEERVTTTRLLFLYLTSREYVIYIPD